jgi:hypothetical protein
MTMTVKELRAKLFEVEDQEAQVIVYAADWGFTPVTGIEITPNEVEIVWNIEEQCPAS